jgi:hypothetical protein
VTDIRDRLVDDLRDHLFASSKHWDAEGNCASMSGNVAATTIQGAYDFTAFADRLLAKYAFIAELPEPDSVNSGVSTWKVGVDRIAATDFGVYVEITRTAAYGGPVDADVVLSLAAALVAAARRSRTPTEGQG